MIFIDIGMKQSPKNKAILKPTATKVFTEDGFQIVSEEPLTIEPIILDDAAKGTTVREIGERVRAYTSKATLTEEERILRILKGANG
jgi:hypothetical protein